MVSQEMYDKSQFEIHILRWALQNNIEYDIIMRFMFLIRNRDINELISKAKFNFNEFSSVTTIEELKEFYNVG